MKRELKAILIAGGLASAFLTSSAAFADKWNMPVRSNERNYFTRNIQQFAEEVKKATDSKVEIVVHHEDSLIKQPEVEACGPNRSGSNRRVFDVAALE